MKHWFLLGLVMVGCIDFDTKLDAGFVAALDGGLDAGLDAGRDPGLDGGILDAGCPGFTFEGWCWVNPTPMGDDLHAVLHRSEDEIWVGGAAGTLMRGASRRDGGHDWQSYKLTSWPSDSPLIVNDFVETQDGGVFAVGSDGLPMLMRLDGTAWQQVGPILADIDRVAASADGTIRGVGNHTGNDYYFDSDGVSVGTTAEGPEGFSSSILALPGGFVRSVVYADGGARVIGAGFDAAIGAGLRVDAYRYNQVRLWLGGDGGLWYGDHGCRVGRLAPPSIDVAGGRPCGDNAIHRAQWSSALGLHVLAGGSGMLIEATDQALLSNVEIATFFDSVVPSTGPRLDGLALFSDGGGMVVGEGGVIASRTSRPKHNWIAENAVLRSHLGGVVSLLDGGIWVVGNDETVAEPPREGGRLRLERAQAEGRRFFRAGWADSSGVVLVGSGGLLPPVPSLDTTSLRGIAGSSRGELAVVGESGAFATMLPDGGWLRGDAGVEVTLTSIVWTPEGFVVSGLVETDPQERGRLYSLRKGVLSPVARFASGVNALVVVDGGVIGVGERTAVMRMVPQVEEFVRCPQCQNADFSAVAALAADDIWAVGNDGVAYHFDGTTWTRVETGTRRHLSGVGVSADHLGHRWLWLVGDFGAIIRRQLN